MAKKAWTAEQYEEAWARDDFRPIARIEALRAASRIGAACIISDKSGQSPDGETLANDALWIAKQFEKYLEGE